jgi:anti-sigma regulatory factor (Ser/Thr protein kinase)
MTPGRHSARWARRLVLTFAVAHRLPLSTRLDATLLVAELVANVVDHVGADHPLELVAEVVDGGLCLSVADHSPTLPVLRRPDVVSPRGRGMVLVHALSARWGVEVHPWGKRVWLQLCADDVGARAEPTAGDREAVPPAVAAAPALASA